MIFHDYEKIKTKNIIIQSPQYISEKYSLKEISYLNNGIKEKFNIQTPYILINYLPICNEGKISLDLPLKILRNKKNEQVELNDYDSNIKKLYDILKKIQKSIKARIIKDKKNEKRDLFVDNIKEKKNLVIDNYKHYNFKTKIYSLNGKPYLKIYNSNKKLCYEQKFQHNRLTRFIIHLDSIWHFEDTYGFNWYIVQAEIKLPDILLEYSFFNDTYKEVEEEIEPNPAFQKYYKMLKMGIPREAINNKIKLDGLDPLVVFPNNSRNTNSFIPPPPHPPLNLPPPPLLQVKLKKNGNLNDKSLDTKNNKIKEEEKPRIDFRIPSMQQLQDQLKKLKKIKEIK